MLDRREIRKADSLEFLDTTFAYLLTGDRDAANDLAQETLARTFAAWPRVRPGEAKAYARRTYRST